MAKKCGSKEVCSHDSTTMYSEPRTSDSSKQKISRIHEMLPDATKEHIARVLAYCDDDEADALNALTKDGGKEAMMKSIELGSQKSKNNKNKKKKKKSKKETSLGTMTAASFDADDSSSLHSSSNIDLDVEKESLKVENGDGVTELIGEIKNVNEQLNDRASFKCAPLEHFSNDNPKTHLIDTPPVKGTHIQHRVLEENTSNHEALIKCSSVKEECSISKSPVSDHSEKHEKSGQRKENHRTAREENHSKYISRQRTGSFHRSKTSSFSEDSSSQPTFQAASAPTRRGYEKCKKDLGRQTTSLQRIQIQLEKGLDDSSKRLKNAFLEIRKMLDKRQELMEQQMEQTKQEALNLLKSRQNLATELKRRVDRTSLTESEWSDLRSDIKQYVTERKYDEELANPAWFSWSFDAITESLNNFGEVRPVKNVYSQRSHSLLGNTSNTQVNPVSSPSSSLANEEINSVSDRNDVGNISDTIEDLPSTEKEVRHPFKSQVQGENRSRVFSNKSYNQAYFNGGRFQSQNQNGNRGRGHFPGRGRSGGYNQYKFSNYRNNTNYYDQQADYRNHSQPNRGRPYPRQDPQNAPSAAQSLPFSNDRNIGTNVRNDNRNNERNHNVRGQHKANFRPRSSQHRTNMGPRSNADNASKTDASASENLNCKDNTNIDKSNAVNGY